MCDQTFRKIVLDDDDDAANDEADIMGEMLLLPVRPSPLLLAVMPMPLFQPRQTSFKPLSLTTAGSSVADTSEPQLLHCIWEVLKLYDPGCNYLIVRYPAASSKTHGAVDIRCSIQSLKTDFSKSPLSCALSLRVFKVQQVSSGADITKGNVRIYSSVDAAKVLRYHLATFPEVRGAD